MIQTVLAAHVRMKVLCFLLLYLIKISVAKTTTNDVTTVDIVIRGLKDQSWSEEEGPCFDQTLTVLKNVRNYTVWAVWIWNSMHQPVGTFYGSEYSLGNYEQCINAPSMYINPIIVTQYCLANVTLTGNKYEGYKRSVLGSTDPYVATKTNIGRNLNQVIWGICLPSTCKPGSISKILKTLYLTNPLTPSVPEITVDYCEKADHKTEYSNGFYSFMILITTLIAVSVISSCYLHVSKTKSGVINRVAESFSIKRNWMSLTKKSNEEIGMLNFTKMSLATLAVSSHTAFFEVMTPISNGLHFDGVLLDTTNPIKNLLKHIDLPVDNFLMLSGLLLVKGLMEKKKKPITGLINRYFRLAASFAIVIFYVASVSIYTGNGPIWQKFAAREQQACADNWWLGLLMLNNYFNSGDICIMVSWYIPVDYQLAVMGTILYIAWQKNRTMGKVLTTITVVLALLIPGVVTYWKKLPGILLFHDLEKILDLRKNDVYLDTYIRSHNRAGPYLIGMAMGYIMTIYKPNNYRNVIPKKYAALLLAVATIVAYKVATPPLSWAELEYDHLSSALYAVFSRNIWVLCSCLTISVLEYGDLAAIRKFTDWHGFAIQSRLTYGIYLTHSVILQQHLFSRKNLQQLDLIYAEGLHSFGVLTVCMVLATLLWVFVEAPTNNIINLFLSPGSKDQSQHPRTKDQLETRRNGETTLKTKHK